MKKKELALCRWMLSTFENRIFTGCSNELVSYQIMINLLVFLINFSRAHILGELIEIFTSHDMKAMYAKTKKLPCRGYFVSVCCSIHRRWSVIYRTASNRHYSQVLFGCC